MLTFDHVHFYYKKGQPVIEDLSFTIETGSSWQLSGRMAAASLQLPS